jgi:hypothetical protein
MPFCPECKAEYRENVTRCSDCDVELVASLPDVEEQEEEEAGLELVELAEFPNPSEADMIRELLVGNEIRSVLRGETDPIGATSWASPVTLLVEQRDEERARQIYEDFYAGEGVPQEDEPAD